MKSDSIAAAEKESGRRGSAQEHYSNQRKARAGTPIASRLRSSSRSSYSAAIPDGLPSATGVPNDSRNERGFRGVIPTAGEESGELQRKKKEGETPRKKTNKQWEDMFNELAVYKDAKGNCSVAVRQGNLGRWVKLQHSSYREGKLSQERVTKLKSIGFNFNWGERKDKSNGEQLNSFILQWEERFDELVVYKGANGNCKVPAKQGKLGTWVNNQRASYNKGKLSQDRITQLEGIGFSWGKQNYSKSWEESFNDLIAYKNANRNCNVPARQGKLGTWVRSQRTSHKKRKLSQDRIALLEGVGFSWVAQNDKQWEERFNELVVYKEAEGNCNVPQNQGNLGTWVSTQRTFHKKGKLSQDRIVLLEGIGFSWSAPKDNVVGPAKVKVRQTHSFSEQTLHLPTNIKRNRYGIDQARYLASTRISGCLRGGTLEGTTSSHRSVGTEIDDTRNTCSCTSKQAVTSGMCHYPYDTDEEEELGAAIYQSSNTAREMMLDAEAN